MIAGGLVPFILYMGIRTLRDAQALRPLLAIYSAVSALVFVMVFPIMCGLISDVLLAPNLIDYRYYMEVLPINSLIILIIIFSTFIFTYSVFKRIKCKYIYVFTLGMFLEFIVIYLVVAEVNY